MEVTSEIEQHTSGRRVIILIDSVITFVWIQIFVLEKCKTSWFWHLLNKVYWHFWVTMFLKSCQDRQGQAKEVFTYQLDEPFSCLKIHSRHERGRFKSPLWLRGQFPFIKMSLTGDQIFQNWELTTSLDITIFFSGNAQNFYGGREKEWTASWHNSWHHCLDVHSLSVKFVRFQYFFFIQRLVEILGS